MLISPEIKEKNSTVLRQRDLLECSEVIINGAVLKTATDGKS